MGNSGMSEELRRAMDKLAFVKFKGADYMTHLGYPECVTLLDMLNDLQRFRNTLIGIHEMAYEDIRTGIADGSVWQIEANARAALGLKVEE